MTPGRGGLRSNVLRYSDYLQTARRRSGEDAAGGAEQVGQDRTEQNLRTWSNSKLAYCGVESRMRESVHSMLSRTPPSGSWVACDDDNGDNGTQGTARATLVKTWRRQEGLAPWKREHASYSPAPL